MGPMAAAVGLVGVLDGEVTQEGRSWVGEAEAPRRSDPRPLLPMLGPEQPREVPRTWHTWCGRFLRGEAEDSAGRPRAPGKLKGTERFSRVIIQ